MDKRELTIYNVQLLILIAEKYCTVKMNLKGKQNPRNNKLKI